MAMAPLRSKRALPRSLSFLLLPAGLLLVFFLRRAPVAQSTVSSSSLKAPLETPPVNVCLLYDRPPRTGSTTMSNALARCLSRKGFGIPPFVKPLHRNQSIARAVSMFRAQSKNNNLGLVSSHVWMTEHDVKLLRQSCRSLLYVTSTAPMWKRVWSAAKMVSKREKNGHSSLSRSDLRVAVDWLREKGARYATFYDIYPWIRVTGPQHLRPDARRHEEVPRHYDPLHNTQPLIPHFVVRQPYLKQDLSALMRALQCSPNLVHSANIHTAIDPEPIADDAHVRALVHNLTGDADGTRHTYLQSLAESGNEAGLGVVQEAMTTLHMEA